MTQILILTVRQLTGIRRLIIVALLALLPVGIVILLRLLGDESSGDDNEEFVNGIVDGLLVGGLMPIVAMTMATAAFGNEIEDRTLSYVFLKPVSRWKIALSKVFAAALIAIPFVVVSGVATTLISGGEDVIPISLAVGASLFLGVLTYVSVFTWAGLVTTRALAAAIVYVFLWEALISSLIGGARYLSVRGYTLAVMHGLENRGLEALSGRVIEFPAAIVGATAVIVIFFGLMVHRLKRMDVP